MSNQVSTGPRTDHRYVALAAVGALGMLTPDFRAGRGASVTGGAVLAHEQRMGNDGRGTWIEAVGG